MGSSRNEVHVRNLHVLSHIPFDGTLSSRHLPFNASVNENNTVEVMSDTTGVLRSEYQIYRS